MVEIGNYTSHMDPVGKWRKWFKDFPMVFFPMAHVMILFFFEIKNKTEK